MGKASRIKQQSAREKIAAQRQAAQKLERRNRLLITGGSTLLVLVIVGAFIAVKLSQGSSTSSSSSAGRTALPAGVVSQVTNVPASTLDQVGKGAVPSFTSTPLSPGSGTTLTNGGKPEMLYIGAEFCPYCAAMRWSMAVALSRFGTFGPLKGIHSSSIDVYPNTATLTFYRQHYSSPYLTFTPVENQTVSKQPLEPVTKEQQAVWVKYDTIQGSQGYPFLYFGGRVIITGPLYNPGVLKGLSWSQIASQLSNPTSTVAQNINGAANYITASICKMTKNSPASVCKAAPIPAIEAKI